MEESSAEPLAKWGTEAALRDERLTDWSSSHTQLELKYTLPVLEWEGEAVEDSYAHLHNGMNMLTVPS